jgi:nucleoside-diphosphate-sugar epimerase
MIREPLAGVRAVCPVPPGTAVALLSPSRTVTGLIRSAEASDAEWGARTAINFPALTTTVAEMAKALEKAAGAQVASLIDWTPDPVISKIVLSWPVRVSADRAKGLGLLPDADFASIIDEYLSENPRKT